MSITSVERQLIARLLNKDKRAVREFYDTYAPLLFRFIRRKINEENDVEEIAQDTLFAFLEGIRDFTGSCKLSTYLCSIAHYKVIDYYRKKKIKRVLFSQLPNGFEALFQNMHHDELSDMFVTEQIAAIFKQLAPRYAIVLQLKYVEGRSVEEIAGKLACSFKTVESVLFRARKAFIKLYAMDEI